MKQIKIKSVLNYLNFRHSFFVGLLALLLSFNLIVPQPLNNQPKPMVLGEATIGDLRGAQITEAVSGPEQLKKIDDSSILADSVIVYDEKSKKTLFEKNPNQAQGIASLTKLLTALVVYDILDLNEPLTVSSGDQLAVTPNLSLKIGDSIKTLDLFNAMLIGSCNDAALMLANHASGKAGIPFEILMNKKAQSLGMASSHFSNPMGFDSTGNFSTANDVKLLVEETQKYGVFSFEGREKSYTFTSDQGTNYKTISSNKLISLDAEIANIKTGFTNQSRGSMITRITHAGHSIVVIVIGSPNREADTTRLKDEIFTNFEWKN